ncbi:Olfactory receptor [Mactra antiquata]
MSLGHDLKPSKNCCVLEDYRHKMDSSVNSTLAFSNFTMDYSDSTVDVNGTTTMVPSAGTIDWKHIRDGFYTAGSVITPIFLATGLFGNIVTIITMASKSFSGMTSRYILIALALSDTTLLLTQPFNKQFMQKLLGYDARALSDFGCKAFFHIFKTGKMTSSWLIVILCFERFIAVVFPFKAKIIITKTSILGLIVIDYLFIGTYNAVWTFSSIIVNGVCKPDVTYPDTKEKYRDFLLAGSSFYSLIPMIIMAILTPIIVVRLIQQKRSRQALTNKTGRNKASDDSVRISVMLIGVVVAYVTFILPITVVHNLAFWRNVSAFDTNTQQFFVLREVAQILELLNYSTNFVLYVFCSTKFRQRALEILGINKCRNAQSRGKPSPVLVGSHKVSSEPSGSKSKHDTINESISKN